MAACAVNRQQKEEKTTYDIMENMTARYNIVYHGRKIIHEAEAENFAAHRDNYQQLLPVLIEPNESTISSHTALMDSVIGKALNIINNKTKSKYINEAYLLTGKANYLKGNYYNAAEFFTYLAGAYADMPEYRQAALVWKARSLMQLGNLTEAGLVLDTAFIGLESDKKSMGLAFATQAKHYLLTHDQESAITMLQQAIAHTRHKPTKLRWHFLTGQLLQQNGRAEEAYGHYSRVVRSNAPYEMAFHAGLNRVFLVTSSDETGVERVRLLRRMLRDGKNKEFKDQIHYHIAETFYADGHLPEALANYELALRQQSGNRYQTTLTYLRLADHHFGLAEYQTAKLYYDSVGMNVSIDFPDAGAVQRKIGHLDELIGQLQIVARQDSLQYLAGLPEAARQTAIDSIITSTYAKIQESKKVPAQQRSAPSIQRSPFEELGGGGSLVTYTDNRFYFNNPDAMGMGQSEFRRRWGNRQLRDNWRFSDILGQSAAVGKETAVADADSEMPTERVEQDSAAWATNIRDSYLDALPDTDEKMAASHQHIHAALIQIGNIYRDDLRDYDEAANAYEELLRRYPDTRDAALIYYNLFRLYSGVDESKATYYREKLLAEFPDALYSHIVRDPTYLTQLEQQRQALNQVYEDVYTQYTQQRYAKVIETVDRVAGSGNPQTMSQLAYLRALALGRVSSIDTFEQALVNITSDFPDDSLITPLVSQHLAFIAEHRDTLTTRHYALQDVDENRERFVDEPTMTQWPQLVINRGPDRPVPRRELTVTAAGQTGIASRGNLRNEQRVTGTQLAKEAQIGEIGPNTYRDLELLPDSATYYFVINVMNGRVNLAPSRFGIGQFNRTRYARVSISHQLKVVDGENQLVFIGPFANYDSAKGYETQLLPLLPDIMKIPADLYNTFVITEQNFGTLSDFDKIDDYHSIYHEQ